MSLNTRVADTLKRVWNLMRNRWTNFPGLTQAQPALVGLPSEYQGQTASTEKSFEETIDDIIYKTVGTTAKSRWSEERVRTRRLGRSHVKKYRTLKTNIVTCLECGHYHERHTICGNCYEKVRKETKEMKKAMGDTLKYNVPESEVVFLYEEDQDDRPKHNGKYIVEMNKPRPQWFSDYLMGQGKKSETGKE